MRTIQLRNERVIGFGTPTYIVAELNTSHFGNTEVACQMIDEVKSAGADCVKFQSWSESSLYSENFYRANPMTKRFMTRFALRSNDLKFLRDYSTNQGLDFASTPYSLEEAEHLVQNCDVPFIKIASMDLNNITFLEDIAKLGVPIFLSTGMGNLEEICRAVNTIIACDNSQIVLLHCTSLYPAPDSLLNMNNIYGFQNEFRAVTIGYSDHSIGGLASIAAVAMGCAVIEKHVTLDSSKIGFDNQMAMEFSDFKIMVSEIRRLEQMLGSTKRTLSDAEVQKSLEMRRSLVAKREISKGEILTIDKLDFKRPGTGIPLHQVNSVLGRVTSRNIQKDFLLAWSDLI